MARPVKIGLPYFSHDTDAASDEKIEALMMLHGPAGYAFYFILLERIYRTNNFELDISEQGTRIILSKKIGIGLQEFENILESAIIYKCFDEKLFRKKNILTCNGIKKRAQIVVEKREQMRKRYNDKAVTKGVSDAETPPETKQKYSRNAPENTLSKVKESKVKESKEYIEEEPVEKISTLDKVSKPKKVKVELNYKDDPEFLDFFNRYPRPVEGATAYKHWVKLNKETKIRIFDILPAYCSTVAGKDLNYIKKPGNFLYEKLYLNDYNYDLEATNALSIIKGNQNENNARFNSANGGRTSISRSKDEFRKELLQQDYSDYGF